MTVTHADRIVFPEIGLTKGELVAYYERVGPFALPHLRGRPLTMQLADGAFVKARRRHYPDWVGSAEVPTSEDTRKRRGGALVMPVVDSVEALAYLANQGLVTPHVWLSRVDRPGYPDRLVFDLDPSDDDFDLVRTTALDARALLEGHGLVAFVKSTGSRGLHVTVPLDRSASLAEVRAFAEHVAAELVAARPDRRTTAFAKADRGSRLFIDVLRNGHGQTEVAAYGVRLLPTAPVAAPLEWDEVGDRSLRPGRWTVQNLFRRLGQRADPWAALDDHARPLPRIPAPVPG
jgi:bifunctional non-homologous end joining protein LigD